MTRVRWLLLALILDLEDSEASREGFLPIWSDSEKESPGLLGVPSVRKSRGNLHQLAGPVLKGSFPLMLCCAVLFRPKVAGFPSHPLCFVGNRIFRKALIEVERRGSLEKRRARDAHDAAFLVGLGGYHAGGVPL